MTPFCVYNVQNLFHLLLFSSETCPVDGHTLGVVVANIAVSEQIGEMMIHCKYGCHLAEDNQTYIVDPACCPVTVKIASRRSVSLLCCAL